MSRVFTREITAILSVITFFGCAVQSSESQPKIYGGITAHIDPADSSILEKVKLQVLASTVRIRSIGNSKCTGVLIEENRILTAGHCFRKQAPFYFIEFGNEAYLENFSDWDRPTPVVRFTLADVHVHPGYQYNPATGNSIDDIATVYFSGVPTAQKNLYKPIDIQVFNQESVKSVIFAGYGKENNRTSSQHLKVGQAKISSYDVSENEFKLSEKDTGPCPGDSGGPLFSLKSDGTLKLLAINVSSTCTSDPAGVRWSALNVKEYMEYFQLPGWEKI